MSMSISSSKSIAILNSLNSVDLDFIILLTFLFLGFLVVVKGFKFRVLAGFRHLHRIEFAVFRWW